MRTLTHTALATATAVFLLTGCGAADDDTGAGGADGDEAVATTEEEAMVDFAACMRDNGIDMPDPGEAGGLVMVEPESGPDIEEYEDAMAECEDLVPVDENAPTEEEMFEQDLRIAECLRENGIDIDDPERGVGLALPAVSEGDDGFEAIAECTGGFAGTGEADDSGQGDS